MKDKFTRREFLGLAGTGLAGLVLAACSPAPAGTEKSPAAPTATSQPDKKPSAPPLQPAATDTPAAVAKEGSGGPINPELLKAVDSSEYIKGQKDLMKRWIDYWGNGQDALMTPDWNNKTVEILFDPSNMPTGADDPKLKEKVNILLDWWRTKPDGSKEQVRSYFPLNDQTGGYQTEPPKPSGKYNIADYKHTGALPLTDHQPSHLVWRKNQFAQVNIENGGKSSTVVERIQNKEPFGWEAATLDAAPVPNKYKVVSSFQVTDWDRQNIDADKSKSLLAKPDAELVAMAPKITAENVQQIFPAIPDHTFTPKTVVRQPTGEVYVKYVDQQDGMTSLWWSVGEGKILQRKDTVQSPEDKWIEQDMFLYNPKDILHGSLKINPDTKVTEQIYEEILRGFRALSGYLTKDMAAVGDARFVAEPAGMSEKAFIASAKSGHVFSSVMIPWESRHGEQVGGVDGAWMDKVKKIPSVRLDKIAVRVLDKAQADVEYSGDSANKPVFVDAAASQAFDFVKIDGVNRLRVTILPSSIVSCNVTDYNKYALDEPCSSGIPSPKVPPTEKNDNLSANQAFRMAFWLYTTQKDYAVNQDDYVGVGYYLRKASLYIDNDGNPIIERNPAIKDKAGNVIQKGLWIDIKGNEISDLPSGARVLTRSDWNTLYEGFATKTPLFVSSN